MTNRQKRGRIQSLELALRIAQSQINDLIAENAKLTDLARRTAARTTTDVVNVAYSVGREHVIQLMDATLCKIHRLVNMPRSLNRIFQMRKMLAMYDKPAKKRGRK